MADTSTQYWYSDQNQAIGAGVALRLRHKVVEKQSPFQKVEIFQTTDFGYLMVLDGCTKLSSRDSFFYHEMMTHPALFSHSQPRNILIVGGGDCGCLQQVLKHPQVERVTQVEMDSLVTEVAKKYFPELSTNTQDDRARLLFANGVDYVRGLASNSFDIIIVDSTYAAGYSQALYEQDFYQACFAALTEHGVLVQQSGSPLLHQQQLKNIREDMLHAGFVQLQTLLFPLPIYPSGNWSCTTANKSTDFANVRAAEAQPFSEQLQYYSPDIHKLCSQLPQFLAKALTAQR
ncbi:polyamine aminopropyltransferase [Catenovulum agarivorans]|uniref:polyamine aminopropyltransferase n=1 Tax=Catenovulum agarivorans TaxID=1172192 RepID=UPI0002E23C64|nr:polyamine aminopropyltransferase [Catenovulum agarivorans]